MDRNKKPTPGVNVLHCSTPKASPLKSDDQAYNDWNDFDMDCNSLDLNHGNSEKSLRKTNFDMTNVSTSNMDGVHQLIAYLANVEHEVDRELDIEKSKNQTSNLNNPNTLSFEHMNSQIPQYKPNTNGSPSLVSGNRLPEQARRGWFYEEGRMVHQELGWREPNHLERAYYRSENNRFYRRRKAREAREMARQMAMEIDPVQPAQDRLNAKRGASQLTISASGSPEEKKSKKCTEEPGAGAPTQHKADLAKTVEDIVADDEAKKAEAAKAKKLADIAYWRNEDVQKMTGRIITTKKEIRMTQLDIPRISQLHTIAMEEKIDDDDDDKIDRVTPLRIGLGGRGLKLHLAHEDGWAWWEELVASIPPLDDKDGGYSYKFLRPGQEPFKYYRVVMSDPRLADKAEGMNVFRRGVRRLNRPLKDIPFTPTAVGTSSVDMIPSTVILISVAVEHVPAFELAMDGLEWKLRMGIESHRVTASKPPRRGQVGGGPGV